MPEASQETQFVPGAAEVLIALLDQLPDNAPPFERVTIEQGTEWQYAARVYRGGLGSFEGYVLSLDASD